MEFLGYERKMEERKMNEGNQKLSRKVRFLVVVVVVAPCSKSGSHWS